MRIPASTNLPDLQQAFRDLWQAIGPLLGDGGQNLDLHGRRITNAGDAVDPRDYVTKQQTGAPGSSAAPLVVDVATIRQTLNVLNQLRFRNAILISPSPGLVQVMRGNGSTFGTLKADKVIGVTEVDAAKFALTGAHAYTPTNVTLKRDGDFSALVLADVRSVLGTLIQDLQAAGLLG